jgi:hypothetical protein
MHGVTHETIERRAYELWEQAGRPFGQSDEFWLRATSELSSSAPVKTSRKAAAPKTKAVAEPASKPKKKPAAKTASKKN